MRWKPKNAVTIVTGASSGIGRSLCTRLANKGAFVVAVARREDRIEELVTENPDRIFGLVGDVTDPATRQQILEKAQSIRDGAVDLLINNAGIGAIGPFESASPERLRQIMEVNFFAPVELIRLLLPSIKRGRNSVICNIGSVLGHAAVPDKSEYCASKFAIHGFSDSLRCELAESGVHVTLVSPSTTRSEFFDSLVESGSSAKSKSIGSWSPEQVAVATISAICARRNEVICSLPGKALVYADRMSPPIMKWILTKRTKKRREP